MIQPGPDPDTLLVVIEGLHIREQSIEIHVQVRITKTGLRARYLKHVYRWVEFGSQHKTTEITQDLNDGLRLTIAYGVMSEFTRELTLIKAEDIE